MPAAFADATAVISTGDGRWAGEIAEGWDIAGNANSGYLLALAGRAIVEATGRPNPVTVTGHHLAPGKPGPVEITTQVVKAGRRLIRPPA